MRVCLKWGGRQDIVVDPQNGYSLEIKDFSGNTDNRCVYFCSDSRALQVDCESNVTDPSFIVWTVKT